MGLLAESKHRRLDLQRPLILGLSGFSLVDSIIAKDFVIMTIVGPAALFAGNPSNYGNSFFFDRDTIADINFDYEQSTCTTSMHAPMPRTLIVS